MNLTATTEVEIATYLRTLPAIRERCAKVFELAKQGKLQYFEYHPEKEADAAAFCTKIVMRNYGSDLQAIPPHGRWRHLDAGRTRVEPLITEWKNKKVDDREICKRLVDLFVVSVLLDAGAGNAWSYKDRITGEKFARSEGLGVASIEMFENGFFSGDPNQPHRVDSTGLLGITADKTAQAMQVSDSNPLVGLEGRSSLLYRLGSALKESPQYFGSDSRPGNIVDFLELESIEAQGTRTVPVAALWLALIEGLNPIWPPSRTKFGGISLGDVWPCEALKPLASKPGDELVPFHKLTGWLTYSLLEPISKVLGWKFEGVEDMTGLPEYRNGGLLVDLGVLTIRPGTIPINEESGLPRVPPSHPAIIEWRAMTVIELDRIAEAIRKTVGVELTLAQILESATWNGGREIAKQLRPETGGPPIEIESDGTVF